MGYIPWYHCTIGGIFVLPHFFLIPYRPDMLVLVESQNKGRLIQSLAIKFCISTISENRTKDGYNLEKAPKRQ